jgi:pyruvate/2-oxoglutarate dehydrogenase complex dihydrolipoamide dehydrogenase (E3) component
LVSLQRGRLHQIREWIFADDETEEVLGVSMVGNSAGEVIHEAAMAMHFHAKSMIL